MLSKAGMKPEVSSDLYSVFAFFLDFGMLKMLSNMGFVSWFLVDIYKKISMVRSKMTCIVRFERNLL